MCRAGFFARRRRSAETVTPTATDALEAKSAISIGDQSANATRARAVEVPNKGGQLRLGMYARCRWEESRVKGSAESQRQRGSAAGGVQTGDRRCLSCGQNEADDRRGRGANWRCARRQRRVKGACSTAMRRGRSSFSLRAERERIGCARSRGGSDAPQ